jgi:hypothetical protein
MSSTKLGSAGDVELLIIAVVALSSSSQPINVFKVRNPIAKGISSLSKTNIYSSNGFHNPNFLKKTSSSKLAQSWVLCQGSVRRKRSWWWSPVYLQKYHCPAKK